MCDKYTWQRQSLFIRDKSVLSLDTLHKDYDWQGFSCKKKSLFVSLTELGAKTI
jgi:hypothetical protein